MQKNYDEFFDFIIKKIDQGTDPLECAGICMAQALRIYKTVLTTEEFNRIVDHILESKNSVQPVLNKKTLH
jgi:hypothetical protein